MATPLEQRRIFLFNNFGKHFKVKYKGAQTSFFDLNLGEQPPQGIGWKMFIDFYFKDETAVKTFFNDAKKLYNAFGGVRQKQTVQSWVPNVDLTKDDPKNLFVEYACDISGIDKVTYCTGTDIKNPNDYIGIYDTNSKLVPVAILDVNEDGVSIDVNFPNLEDDPLYEKYTNVTLIHTKNENFDIYANNQRIPGAIVTFKSDKSGFDFDLAVTKGKATKRKDNTLPINTSKTDNKKTDNTKTDDKKTVNTNNEKVVVNKKVYVYPDVDVKDEPPIEGNRDCNDYPFKPGCINDDIGDLNQMFFNDRRGNVFSTRLLKKLNFMGLIDPNDKDPKITQEIFNQVMSKFKKNVIKESVKKVLKEYINKKK